MNLIELDRELRALGTELAEESMTLVADGTKVNAQLDGGQDYLYLYASAGTLAEDADSGLLRSLFGLNTLGVKTRGGSLGLLPDGELVYSRRYRIESMESGFLAGELSATADTARQLARQIADLMAPAETPRADGDADSQAWSGYDAFADSSIVPFGWLQA